MSTPERFVQIVGMFAICLILNSTSDVKVIGTREAVTKFETDHFSHYENNSDSYRNWPELASKNKGKFCRKFVRTFRPRVYRNFIAAEPCKYLLYYWNLTNEYGRMYEPRLVTTLLCYRPFFEKCKSTTYQYFITRSDKDNCVYSLDKIPRTNGFHIIMEHCDFEDSEDPDGESSSKGTESNIDELKCEDLRGISDEDTKLSTDINKSTEDIKKISSTALSKRSTSDGEETSATSKRFVKRRGTTITTTGTTLEEADEKPIEHVSSMGVGGSNTKIWPSADEAGSLFSSDSPTIPLAVDPESGLFDHVFEPLETSVINMSPDVLVNDGANDRTERRRKSC